MPSAFRKRIPKDSFSTPAWVAEAVFYQIFVDRFRRGEPACDPLGVLPWGSTPTPDNFMGGNLRGILEGLDYLTDLGITALYLTPIFESPSNHKYDAVDYFKVDPQFGDLDTLKQLVDECHRRGLRVILDAVFNHCSCLHPFFLDVRQQGRQSKYWPWFHVRKWPFPERFGPAPEAARWYDCWWGIHTLPKFNYRHPEVEAYFLDVATYWLREAGVDGWRLDVPNEIIRSFWPKFRQAVKAVNPETYIVGEIWEDATVWLRGDQFDGVMNYPLREAAIDYFVEQSTDTAAFDQTLHRLWRAYPAPAVAAMLNLLGSHDTARIATLARPRGKRDPAFDTVKLLVAFQLTCEGAPCIYYGDEIGLEGEKDPGCRGCFPWDWQRQSNSRTDSQVALRHYHQKLIAIRQTNSALRHGTFRTLQADARQAFYAFERVSTDNHCIVALNRSPRDQALTLPMDAAVTELLHDFLIQDARLTVPARQAAIVRIGNQTLAT